MWDRSKYQCSHCEEYKHSDEFDPDYDDCLDCLDSPITFEVDVVERDRVRYYYYASRYPKLTLRQEIDKHCRIVELIKKIKRMRE